MLFDNVESPRLVQEPNAHYRRWRENETRMTAYRFRVEFDPDPMSMWRDIVVGSDRSLDELFEDVQLV